MRPARLHTGTADILMATMAPQLFGRADDNREDEEQLLRLFWNRAELKKEFDKLRDESFGLKQQLKEQEARTLRVQHRLEQLEARLASPEHSLAAVAHYQLRGVWESCHQRLAFMAAELERAQLDKGRLLHQAAHQRQLARSVETMRAELHEVVEASERASVRVRAVREQRSARTGIWNFFRRRLLTGEINTHRDQRRSLGKRAAELSEDIQARLNAKGPDYAGLSVEDKRLVNVTLIAFAQELYLHYADRDLAGMAREAAISNLADIDYGSRRDCRNISKHVEERLKQLASDDKLQSRVQARSFWLQSRISYRHDYDAAPDSAALGLIPVLKADGRQKGEFSVNVLADEYWDVFAVLLD